MPQTVAPMLARSYLFVPAIRPERIDKALASGADAVIVDFEDAVAPEGKREAREAVAQWLAHATGEVWLRINATASEWFDDDAALASHASVAGVMLPKAESADEVQRLARRVPGKPLLPMVETAVGLDVARDIGRVEGVERLAFGSLDFAVDLGLADDEASLAPFRALLVMASRLAGCAPPVDGVTVAIDDEPRLAGETARARSQGFRGKLCIHPKQVAIVNRAFAPTPEELAWARRVLAAVEASHGHAVAVDGRMVDRPVIVRAEMLLAQERGA